jgi:hypothetical protein
MIQSAVAGRNGGNGAVMETRSCPDQAVVIFQTPIMATLITHGSLSPYRYPLLLLPPSLLSFFSYLSRVDSRPFNLSFTSGYVWITFADKDKTLTRICRSPSLIEIPLRNSQEEFY